MKNFTINPIFVTNIINFRQKKSIYKAYQQTKHLVNDQIRVGRQRLQSYPDANNLQVFPVLKLRFRSCIQPQSMDSVLNSPKSSALTGIHLAQNILFHWDDLKFSD